MPQASRCYGMPLTGDGSNFKKMYSDIENYEGHWKNRVGNTLHISIVNETTALVSFFVGERLTPLIRPWFNNKPAIDMNAYYHPEVGPDVEVELGGSNSGFRYNLCFEQGQYVNGKKQNVLMPSIVRYEEEHYLEKYYSLLGALEGYVNCNQQ